MADVRAQGRGPGPDPAGAASLGAGCPAAAGVRRLDRVCAAGSPLSASSQWHQRHLLAVLPSSGR